MHLCVRSQLDGGTEEGQVQNAAVSLVESVFLPWVWRHKSLSRKKTYTCIMFLTMIYNTFLSIK
jgi:hypothetical protein